MSMQPNPYEAPRYAGAPPLVAQVVPDDAQFVVHFETTIDDVLAWNAYFQRTSSTLRRYRLIVVAALVLLILLLPPLMLPQLQNEVLFFTCLAVVALLLGLTLLRLWGRGQWSSQLLLRRMYGEGRNLNLFGPRQVTLTSEYLLAASPLSQTILRWQGVEKVVRDGDYIFLQVSSMAAIIIPRRAFTSDEEIARFVHAASEFQTRSQTAIDANLVPTPSV